MAKPGDAQILSYPAYWLPKCNPACLFPTIPPLPVFLMVQPGDTPSCILPAVSTQQHKTAFLTGNLYYFVTNCEFFRGK